MSNKLLNLNDIVFIGDEFPTNQYYKQPTKKTQIVLHHTVSGGSALGDINWWKMTAGRIATHFIVDRSGVIYQLYSSKYWAHHIGVTNKVFGEYNIKGNNLKLNQNSIGIEIDSWGPLMEDINTNKWYPVMLDENTNIYKPNIRSKHIDVKNIEFYPNGYRGFFAYEKYTQAQLESVSQLLVYLTKKHNIPKTYNSDMWYMSTDALNGFTGIWSHVSYRPDKTDCHPQTSLKIMLSEL